MVCLQSTRTDAKLCGGRCHVLKQTNLELKITSIEITSRYLVDIARLIVGVSGRYARFMMNSRSLDNRLPTPANTVMIFHAVWRFSLEFVAGRRGVKQNAVPISSMKFRCSFLTPVLYSRDRHPHSGFSQTLQRPSSKFRGAADRSHCVDVSRLLLCISQSSR